MVFLISCATSLSQRFDKINLGMDKTELLDRLGSPNYSEFKNGQNEWVYIYYVDNQAYAKRLIIENQMLTKIQDFKPQLNRTYSPDSSGKIELKKEDVLQIKKALQQNKKIRQYEEGFEEIK